MFPLRSFSLYFRLWHMHSCWIQTLPKSASNWCHFAIQIQLANSMLRVRNSHQRFHHQQHFHSKASVSLSISNSNTYIQVSSKNFREWLLVDVILQIKSSWQIVCRKLEFSSTVGIILIINNVSPQKFQSVFQTLTHAFMLDSNSTKISFKLMPFRHSNPAGK